jgi:hypothetical protein
VSPALIKFCFIAASRPRKICCFFPSFSTLAMQGAMVYPSKFTWGWLRCLSVIAQAAVRQCVEQVR